MLLSIEAQPCTRRECKTFQPQRPSSVAMHKVCVRRCTLYVCTAVLQSESMSAARMNLYSIPTEVEFGRSGGIKVPQRPCSSPAM